jgi:6-pyruvoyl-tetrahydropterin synthase
MPTDSGLDPDERVLTVDQTTSTAHRLFEYDGACGSVHGHNLRWELTAVVSMMDPEPSTNLDLESATGAMPVDLKDLRATLDTVDHAVLLYEDDPLADVLASGDVEGQATDRVHTFETDPTCETLVWWMAHRLTDEHNAVQEVRLTLHETAKYAVTTEVRDGG